VSDYAVYGKKGTGKSKFAVYLMREAAKQHRRIACNFPIDLDRLLPEWHRVWYTQLPDRPTRRDLDALGHGNPECFDEDRNGVLILDELSVWLNSRSFQDKGREDLVDWAVHARKFGWDCYWLCQNPLQIDRQVRESLLEYSVRMKKLDQVRLPFVGYALQVVGLRGTFPKGTHSAVVRLGFEHDSPLVDRKVFKGNELHDCYDTRYVFRADPEQCTVTHLGPRYFVPRVAQRKLGLLEKIAAAVGGRQSADFASRPSSQPARVWPESVMRLDPDQRWEIAKRLSSASPAASRNVLPFQRPIAKPNDRPALSLVGKAI
jgi:hypothetical protein